MAGSPSSVLDPGGRRPLNSRPEPPPRQREKVGGLFSADNPRCNGLQSCFTAFTGARSCWGRVGAV